MTGPTDSAVAAAPDIDEAVYRRRWWTLGILCLSLVMLVVANSSLNVAMAEGVKRVTRLINQMRFLARDALISQEVFPLAPLQSRHDPTSGGASLQTIGNETGGR